MIVNARETKEMLIGAAISKHPPPLVTLSGALIDRVVTFKLLGVNVANDLKWNRSHIKKCCVLRPVLEYASPVRHSSLTVAQTKALEYLQKRAMNIMFSGGIDHTTCLITTGVDRLATRREYLTKRFSVGEFCLGLHVSIICYLKKK